MKSIDPALCDKYNYIWQKSKKMPMTDLLGIGHKNLQNNMKGSILQQYV